jgi:cytochrome P450
MLDALRAWAGAWRRRSPLPPGDLVPLDELERGHRTLLVERAATLGPVFKGLMEKRIVVCVVGHARARRLLKEHAAALRPVTIDIKPVVPAGFLRQMEGDTHRHYRKALVQAVNAIDTRALAPRLEPIIAEGLRAHAADPAAGGSPAAWADRLSQIATSLLVAAFLGAAPGTRRHADLVAGFRRLGPQGVAWQLTSRQTEAFGALRDLLAAPPADALLPGSFWPALQAGGALDETLIGNVVYMVELGRYDVRGLLRWLSKYAGEQLAWLDRVAAEAAAGALPAGQRPAAEAFALETLRMDQSERLMRDVLQDIVFDGWLIPKGSLVRVCLWETHKLPETFPDPFRFDPARFLDAAAAERFSPFGLDHHLCPLAGLSLDLAAMFVRVLARDWQVEARDGDPAARGPYHWQPSPRLLVRLSPRRGAAALEG